jgi:hypothetical protein
MFYLFLKSGFIWAASAKVNSQVQYTSESRTIRHSNGQLSDTFLVRLSNGTNDRYPRPF